MGPLTEWLYEFKHADAEYRIWMPYQWDVDKLVKTALTIIEIGSAKEDDLAGQLAIGLGANSVEVSTMEVDYMGVTVRVAAIYHREWP